MTFYFTYEQRLIIFKKWFYIKFSAADMICANWNYYNDSILQNRIKCHVCDANHWKWFMNTNSLQKHLNQNAFCFVIWNTQNQRETNDVAVNFKSRFKIKFNKFFKFFKFEKFAINFNFNSTSIKSISESIIRLDVVFVVSFKSRAKINFKLIKFDEFTINFNSNSISIKSEIENVFLIANSNSISISAVKQIVIETIKSEIINFMNINFFDFIMQINFWDEFNISINIANFLHHLIETIVKYQKKDITRFFSQCLRDFALQWLKNQLKFISLNDFKTIITKKNSFSSISEVSLDQTIIDFSSQKYHRCLECDVQFSSTSRFLTHTQKNCFKSFTCKHCEKTFASNNKFHEYVRLHHIKKNYNNKTLKQRFVEKRNNHINLSISRFIFSITFKLMTASTKSSYLFISMTKAQIARFIVFSIDFSITSMNSIAFKSSRRYEFTCMFFTISSNSFQTSILLHSTSLQKITIMKSKFHYLNIFSTTSESILTILKFSHHSIIMINASIVCSLTFSSTSSRSSIVSH